MGRQHKKREGRIFYSGSVIGFNLDLNFYFDSNHAGSKFDSVKMIFFVLHSHLQFSMFQYLKKKAITVPAVCLTDFMLYTHDTPVF